MDKQKLKIKEPGLYKIQDGHLDFSGSLADLIFIWWFKALLSYSFNTLTMSSLKKKKKVSLNIKY